MTISKYNLLKIESNNTVLFIDSNKAGAFDGFLQQEHALIAQAIIQNLSLHEKCYPNSSTSIISFIGDMPDTEYSLHTQTCKVTLLNSKTIKVTSIFPCPSDDAQQIAENLNRPSTHLWGQVTPKVYI
ncbi:MAG: hypothetical protein ACI9TY_000739 [Alphaproteobacteria bacterium]|jgi:hypothetical protein